jgi:hypothetical protein
MAQANGESIEKDAKTGEGDVNMRREKRRRPKQRAREEEKTQRGGL